MIFLLSCLQTAITAHHTGVVASRMQHRSIDFWSSKQPEISRRTHVISWGSTACSRYYVTLQVPVTLAHVTVVTIKTHGKLKSGFPQS